MEKEYYVYMHTFPNDKKYIGITCCKPERRWQNGYGYAAQPYIYNAIKKYGWQNIKHEIICEGLSLEEASKKERELIAYYGSTNKANGYNIDLGGKACGHLTEEHKKKIGAANSGAKNGQYGKRYTEEERRQMSINSVWRGKKHTLESRKKMSEYAKAHPEQYSHKGIEHPMFGKHHSEDARKKMSQAAKRRGYCGNQNKKIDMLSLEGEYIRTFQSIEEAAKHIGKEQGAANIGSVCRGKRHYAYGYIWRYADVS